MTEDEAKTKWCPFARVARHDCTFCIGSACMAFRWLPDVTATLGGQTVRVDAVDADLLRGCWWDGRYARRDDGRLHRLIAERVFGPSNDLVDHIDGDPANCRRGNLRIVTPAQNAANAASRGGRSRFRGVFQSRGGRWSAQISRLGIRKHLGTFNTEEEAAAAYDAAAAKIHGSYCRPNLDERANVGRHGYCGLAGKP